MEFSTGKGKITGFTVNYRANIQGTWSEVIRYDTHHERLHVHRFWRRKTRQVETLEEEGPAEDYTTQLKTALEDILTNWQHYRRLHEEARG